MDEQLRQSALEYHQYPNRAKSRLPRPSLSPPSATSPWPTPRVAAACDAIVEDPLNAYKYTARGNLVAVISTAPLCWAWAISARWPASR